VKKNILYLLLTIVLFIAPACSAVKTEESVPTPTVPSANLPAILPEAGEPGTFQRTRCRFILPEEIIEGQDVECGYLTVLESRSEDGSISGSRLIQLAVAILHPPGGASQPEPVIYLSGGPGFGVLELIHYQYEALSEPVFATGRDLVLFDQRGVGISRPALDCPGLDELSRDLLDRQVDGQEVDQEQVTTLLLESIGDCREMLAEVADLSAYNSAASADDMHDLRLALGYEQVNLWGGSYGTRLALETMRRHPEALRSVVLDAVYPPDVNLYLEAPANFQRALDRLFEACQSNDVCSARYPDLREVFFATVSKLNANPLLRKVDDPFTGDSYQTFIDGDTVMALTFQLLYDSTLRYLLPAQIYAASQGEYTAFDRARLSLLRLSRFSSRGMMLSVQCHEEVPFSKWEDFQAELANYPEFADMYADSILGGVIYRACEVWGAGQAAPRANQPVYSDVPTLLMSGEFDPITPPSWGRRAARTLESAFTYEYPGIGHGASAAHDCPRSMMIAFLNDPGQAPDDRCILEMK
jgi:pimeloyl-ACP methyl ester carboxylesterase